MLTTKYRKSFGNPLRRREFSQHDCATGVDPSQTENLLQRRRSEQRERTFLPSFTEDFWWSYARRTEIPRNLSV